MTPVKNYRYEVDHPVLMGGVGPDGQVHEPTEIDLNPDRVDYVTTDGVEVWIERKHQRTRFLDADGNQVGPWHANLVPAIVWAANEGWRDPTSPDWFNDAVIAEVRAGGSKPQKGQRGYVEPGAWTP